MPLFSSKKTEYITPKALFDELDRKHHFVLDPCTREDNPLQTLHYYTKKGLKLDWNFGGAIYVNPPYSREIPKWIKKALEQNKKFGITICMLLPARVDTKWFHHYLYNKEPRIKICFLEGRLKFRDTKHSHISINDCDDIS
jgi:site-specific DNA-methyltransferase (adenine-specific)